MTHPSNWLAKLTAMTTRRVKLLGLLVGMALLAWPVMMLIHELGHVLGAWFTGGTVVRLVWHPLVFSRTDVDPNPQPMIVVWCGPTVGCMLPILIERIVAWLRPSASYLLELLAGFCLLANGAYIGLGGFEAIGDAGDMLRLGSPQWVLITFGLVASAIGLFYWHLASRRLGFGNKISKSDHVNDPSAEIPAGHIILVLVLAMALNLIALIIGNPGT